MKLKKSIRISLLIMAQIFTLMFIMNINNGIPTLGKLLIACGMLIAINLIYFIEEN